MRAAFAAAASVATLVCGACANTPTASPPQTQDLVGAYVNAALDIMQANSINRLKIDWPDFRALTLSQAANAKTTPQTYAALRDALKRLGDNHSVLIPPAALVGAVEDIAGKTLPNRIAWVQLPAFSGGGAASLDFSNKLQSMLVTLDADNPCGWIVDLRKNSGGNMWPMLAGIGPVLGEGDVGFFVAPAGSPTTWFYLGGNAGTRSGSGNVIVVGSVSAQYFLKRSMPPVAVLIGPQTASSGEAIAVAFHGRPLTRFFGAPSAGVPTANAGFVLSDGAQLLLTVAADADRQLFVFWPNAIAPDETQAWTVVDPNDPGDMAAAAARGWLSQQDACKT